MFKVETAVVTVSKKKNGGRPTHNFLFKVNSNTSALRVSLSERGKRVVSWMNPLDSHKSFKRGNTV